MISSSVTVGSAPVPIVGLGAPITQGQNVRIKNTSGNSKLVIGGPEVTPDNGWTVHRWQWQRKETRPPTSPVQQDCVIAGLGQGSAKFRPAGERFYPSAGNPVGNRDQYV